MKDIRRDVLDAARDRGSPAAERPRGRWEERGRWCGNRLPIQGLAVPQWLPEWDRQTVESSDCVNTAKLTTRHQCGKMYMIIRCKNRIRCHSIFV